MWNIAKEGNGRASHGFQLLVVGPAAEDGQGKVQFGAGGNCKINFLIWCLPSCYHKACALLIAAFAKSFCIDRWMSDGRFTVIIFLDLSLRMGGVSNDMVWPLSSFVIPITQRPDE